MGGAQKSDEREVTAPASPSLPHLLVALLLWHCRRNQTGLTGKHMPIQVQWREVAACTQKQGTFELLDGPLDTHFPGRGCGHAHTHTSGSLGASAQAQEQGVVSGLSFPPAQACG